MLQRLTHRFDEAVIYSHHWHTNQSRWGTGIPYISHPLAVAAIVLEYGGTEDEVIAALLHDTVKDGPRNTGELRPLIERQISNRFGKEVVKIISGCAIPADPDPQQSWQTQREIYLQQLETADQSALLVAAADKLHNVQSFLRIWQQVGDPAWEQFGEGKQSSLWYFRSLGELFHRRRLGLLSAELMHVIQQLPD